MSKKRRAASVAPAPTPAPESVPARGGLLDRWWVGLLAALWITGIVVIYYRFQLERLTQVLTR